MRIQPKVGRPPKKAEPGTSTTITLRLDAKTKNTMISQAQAYDMTLTEYLISLVERDAS